MTRNGIVKLLKEYFAKKGQTMSYKEYVEQDDWPVRPVLVKRIAGPWNRVLRLVGEIEPLEPEPVVQEVKPSITEK